LGAEHFFFFTDNFWGDYNKMVERKTHIVRPTKKEPYGSVAVFEGLYEICGIYWNQMLTIGA